MPKVRYRPRIRELISRVLETNDIGDIVEIDIKKMADVSGISRQTIYSWIKSDSSDPEEWMIRPDMETAHRFQVLFSRLLGEEEVEVLERIEMECSKIRTGLPVTPVMALN